MMAYVWQRIFFALQQYPQRLIDFWRHVVLLEARNWYVYRHFKWSPWFFLIWLLDSGFLLLDLLLVPDFYDLVSNLIKRSTPLANDEKEVIRRLFGHALPLGLIRKDKRAYLVTAHTRTTYVSFFTINCYHQPLPPVLLAHEAMHLIQYQAFGSRYINHALWAQHWAGGYNYGGLAGLDSGLKSDYGLHAFNFEQMAEIAEDCYRTIERSGSNPSPAWSSYALFLQLVKKGIRNFGV